jgi:hypothetical protein
MLPLDEALAQISDIRGHLVRTETFRGYRSAIVCLTVAAIEMSLRCARGASPLRIERTLQAVEQFVPCLAAGALLTCVVYRYAGACVWMLPGLWSILFSLGIFASWRMLPRPTIWVAAYYLAAGTLSLAIAQGERALAPWVMGGTFGVGQTLAAAILYYMLERRDERT